MRIRCLPRTFFERLRGTPEEERILSENKVISIQSKRGWDAVPPFSQERLGSPHLLCLVFDDYFGIPDDPAEQSEMALFTPAMAEQILRFVDDHAHPVLIHCTEGVSRSGAVGTVLNEYFNRQVADRPEDYRCFFADNPRIMPNPNVLKIMQEVAAR